MDNLEEVLVEILSKLYSRIIYGEEKILKEMMGDTLSIKELHTLELVYTSMASGNNTAGNIASRLGITLGTLTTNVDRLSAKGLLHKVKHDSDRRVVYIELTEKGKQVYTKHIAMHKKKIATAIDKLSTTEKVALMNAVSKMEI